MEFDGSTGTASEALQVIEGNPPDLVLVDVSLHGMSGLEMIKRASTQLSDTYYLAVSTSNEMLLGPRVFAAGGHGFIEKGESTDDILTAIWQVLQEGYYASSGLQRKMGRSDGSLADPLTALSDRELEVFERIGRGLTTREIADELFISIKTVQSHRGNAMEKLDAASVADFTRIAVLSIHALNWE